MGTRAMTRNLNPGSHSCEPSAQPLSYTAIPPPCFPATPFPHFPAGLQPRYPVTPLHRYLNISISQCSFELIQQWSVNYILRVPESV